VQTEDKNATNKGAREMRNAGLIITLSIILSLVVVVLIVIFGHIRLF
jgi:hypothetical protein